MMQVDEYIYTGTLGDEALIDETRRALILQRMTTFIREMVGRSRFAHPSGPISQTIIYTRRERHPPNTEFESVQDDPRPSHPINE